MTKAKELHPSKRLDVVLKYLYEYPDRDNELLLIKGYVSEYYKIEFEDKDLQNIIDKLLFDKLIEPRTAMGSTASYMYTKTFYDITFEGESLLEIDLGYSGKLQREDELKERMALQEQRNLEYQIYEKTQNDTLQTLSRQTVKITRYGACIAGCVLLIEIIRLFSQDYPRFPSWYSLFHP